jgi:hypothetical protein
MGHGSINDALIYALMPGKANADLSGGAQRGWRAWI